MNTPLDLEARKEKARRIRASLQCGLCVPAYKIFQPEWGEKLADLPPNLIPGIASYILAGRSMGDFLTALFGNDLMATLGRADDTSLKNLTELTRFIYNYAPTMCHGSAGKVKAWTKEGGALGFYYDNLDLEVKA